ncbi:MAG TPA: hypothetical protein VLG49_03410 [Rhabdochlamydiaceae bacterium]|nr:hypothetical protein [Rhabdochlamydiaceae bacterium]
MRIKIAERLHPFSHTPGVSCIVPNTSVEVEVFPVLLRFKDLDSSMQTEYKLDLKGPVRNFTVVQDLEKMCVRVFGHFAEGYVRYHIVREEKGLAIVFEKAPGTLLARQMNIEMPMSIDRVEVQPERLSLGIDKKQDWDLVVRRQDLKEIFPIWLRLGQLLGTSKIESSHIGTLSLLDVCEELVAKREKIALLDAFLNVFNAGFRGIMVPRLSDDQFQGLAPEIENSASGAFPLPILINGSSLVRSLFFEEDPNSISFLPCLLSNFDCGRFINIQSMHGEIDMEWSKKMLRRVVIRCKTNRELFLRLQNSIKKFRIRKSQRDRGKVIESGKSILLNENETLLLDRFQR